MEATTCVVFDCCPPPQPPSCHLPLLQLPVIVFSHGLGGFPESYTILTAELASRGFIVICPEHHDGTAAFARVAWEKHGLTHVRLTEEEAGDERLSHSRRSQQLTQRAAEVGVVLELLAEFRSARAKVKEGKTLKQLPADLQLFRDILAGAGDFNNVFLMGHSMGAATMALVTSAEANGAPLGADDVRTPLDTLNSDRAATAYAAYAGERAAQASRGRVLASGAKGAVGGVRPRVAVRATVLLDPWYYPLPPAVMARGYGGVPVLTLLGKYFASEAMWRNERAARVLSLATDRAEAAAAFGDVGAADKRCAASVAKHGLSNGLDWHGAPVVPLDGPTPPLGRNADDELREGSSGAGGLAAYGVHPETAVATVAGMEHQNFNDFSVQLPTWLGRHLVHIGAADSVAGLVYLADAVQGYCGITAYTGEHRRRVQAGMAALRGAGHASASAAVGGGAPLGAGVPHAEVAPLTRALLARVHEEHHGGVDGEGAYLPEVWKGGGLVSRLQAAVEGADGDEQEQ